MEKGKQIAKKFSNLDEIESKELIKSLIQDALLENSSGNLSIDDKLNLLKKCSNALNTKQLFKIGDFVQWKPNLKNRAMPDYNEPMIVVDLIDEPIFDEEEGPSSVYYNEPLDIILGMIDEDDEFITFFYDSRRIQKFKKK